MGSVPYPPNTTHTTTRPTTCRVLTGSAKVSHRYLGSAQATDFPAESAALPLATWALAEHLQGADVIWFIDNEAAASAGIRSSSGLPEVDIMIQAAHWMWMELDVRVWIEWIDSLSNPSDGLSRAGWEDAWTLQQQWQRMHVGDPPWSSDLSTPHALTKVLLEDIGRRRGNVGEAGCSGLPCRHQPSARTNVF